MKYIYARGTRKGSFYRMSHTYSGLMQMVLFTDASWRWRWWVVLRLVMVHLFGSPWRNLHNLQNLTMWVLLADNIQGWSWLCFSMWPIPVSRQYYTMPWTLYDTYSLVKVVLLIEDCLYGPFGDLLWYKVLFGGGGLCIKVGGSGCSPQYQRYKCHHHYVKAHLLSIWHSTYNH